MTETYIRSLYENIYVDGESIGDGYYTLSGVGYQIITFTQLTRNELTI